MIFGGFYSSARRTILHFNVYQCYTHCVITSITDNERVNVTLVYSFLTLNLITTRSRKPPQFGCTIWTMLHLNIHRSYRVGQMSFKMMSSVTRLSAVNRPSNDFMRYAVAVRFASTDRSKVENTLKMLREDIQKQQDDEVKRLKLIPAKGDVAVKLSLKDKIVHELKHYYHGFRLLALETRLSAKYCWRMMKGATLSRRERQQLVRTVSDLFRMVPFTVFIIVPFMEFALPIFIKLFPNMLPSTFQESSKEEEKLRKQVKVKMEMAKFIQDTIEEIALERKSKNKNESSKALDFTVFMKKVRREGGYVSNEELFKFSKLFEDELTLDNLSMSQLRSLCRLMLVQPLGSPEILRFQLNMKLRELKADDKQIAAEGGVEALSTLDLQQACRARGMRALGLSEARLRDQLIQWLELSLNDKVPPSLLLLSRTLYLSEDVPFTDRLKAIVQSLPEGIAEQTRQKLTEIEGGQIDHKERIALIRQIEDAISEEKKIDTEKKRQEQQQKEIQEEKAKSAVEELRPSTESVMAEAIASTVEKVQEKSVKTDVSGVVEQLSALKKIAGKVSKADGKMDQVDISHLEQIIVGGPIHEAKHDIIGLKEKVIEHSEDLLEINSLDGAFSETKVAKRLRNKLNSLIENVDSLVTKLEEEKRNADESIADPASPGSSERKHNRQVRISDLIDSLTHLQKDVGGGKRERIEEILKILDDDRDGVLDAALVLEVIELLEKHKDVQLSPAEMASLIETLKKEDEAEAAAKALESAKLDAPITPQVNPNVTAEAGGNDGPLSIPEVDSEITSSLNQQKSKEKGKKLEST